MGDRSSTIRKGHKVTTNRGWQRTRLSLLLDPCHATEVSIWSTLPLINREGDDRASDVYWMNLATSQSE